MRGELGFPVRLRYAKRGKVRFVSHRDVARALERAFRIEQLPLAFTQGFSPRPKVSFGLALGVGHESVAEYLDVELAEPVDVGRLPADLSAALPEGIAVTGAAALAARAPALQEVVSAVEVSLTLADVPTDALTAAVERAASADSLAVATTRKGVPVTEDLRPALRHLAVRHDGDVCTVDVRAATRPRGLRPADLLTALRDLAGAPSSHGGDRVLRTHQWIERDGARLEPLDADRASCAEPSAHLEGKGPEHDRRHDTGGTGLRPDSRAGVTLPADAGLRIA